MASNRNFFSSLPLRQFPTVSKFIHFHFSHKVSLKTVKCKNVYRFTVNIRKGNSLKLCTKIEHSSTLSPIRIKSNVTDDALLARSNRATAATKAPLVVTSYSRVD